MNSSLKNIGGDFSIHYLFPFLHDSELGHQYFPQAIGHRERVLLETGTDAICYATTAFSRQQNNPLRLWFPLHYCQGTINRVAAILNAGKVKFELASYTELDEGFVSSLGNRDLLLYLHFNRYEPVPGYLLSAKTALGFFLLEDFVLAPFDINNTSGDAGFNSLRKVSPLSISILYTAQEGIAVNAASPYGPARKAAALLKSAFESNHSAVLENNFLRGFEAAEALLEARLTMANPGMEDEVLLDFTNWEKIRGSREHNYEVLEQACHLPASMRIGGEYQFFMIHIKDRDALRKTFFKNHIFPAIHWADSKSPLAASILSMPVDQRYTPGDMLRIAEVLNEHIC